MALLLFQVLSCIIIISSNFVSCDNPQRRNRTEANGRSLKIQCPKNQTFCEKVPNYPSTIIREIMKKNPALLYSYFRWTTMKPLERVTREAGTDTDESASSCDVIRRITYPGLMNNTRGEQKYIINNIYYWQPVTLIKCKDKNSSCGRGKRSFFGLLNSLGGKTQRKCIQKSKNVKLITYDPIKWTGEYDTFKIPSGCSCRENKN